jgi:endothelin-converting enzyme/putative endopeptidase
MRQTGYNTRVRIATLFLVTAASVTVAVHAQAPNSPTGPAAPIPNPASIDKTADPCTDFYQYACGGWLASNTIPADRASWGTGEMLGERNSQVLRGILEHTSDSSTQRSAVEQKIGDYYFACMDEQTVNARGYDPIKPELAHINALADKAAVRDEVPRLHRVGNDVFFEFGSETDSKDSNHSIGAVHQGGLGLPDRDFYLNDDARAKQIRQAYVEHVQKMLQLIGESPETAASGANAVLAFETLLAKRSLDRVSRRDPDKIYHKLPISELAKLCPFISWDAFLSAVGAPKMESLNIDYPDFFGGLNAAFEATSAADLKAYLKWHLVHNQAALLSQPFVEENFAFYSNTLRGIRENRARWKRCVETTDLTLGDALGQKYVDVTFGAEGKLRTLKMVKEIERAMNGSLGESSWMTPATKKEALVKLEAITNRIGYPDKWRDYSSVRILRDDFAGNWIRATEFDVQRDLHKIGKPVDRSEWPFTTPTVDAGYSPEENSINFPAGILQPPLYSNNSDDAANYGAGGAIIGHELTHGFDDEGRKFDAQGNLRDWWTKPDAEEFQKRAKCLVDEYSKFEAVPGVHLNGELTLGENTADLGGLRMAFLALMDSLKGKEAAIVNGFTPEQRFFLSYGQAFCQLQRPQMASMRAHTDPHSPPRYRTNGVVQNMPEFQKAFSCSAGKPMVAAPACRIW